MYVLYNPLNFWPSSRPILLVVGSLPVPVNSWIMHCTQLLVFVVFFQTAFCTGQLFSVDFFIWILKDTLFSYPVVLVLTTMIKLEAVWGSIMLMGIRDVWVLIWLIFLNVICCFRKREKAAASCFVDHNAIFVIILNLHCMSHCCLAPVPVVFWIGFAFFFSPWSDIHSGVVVYHRCDRTRLHDLLNVIIRLSVLVEDSVAV